jgi:hypothetical protein
MASQSQKQWRNTRDLDDSYDDSPEHDAWPTPGKVAVTASLPARPRTIVMRMARGTSVLAVESAAPAHAVEVRGSTTGQDVHAGAGHHDSSSAFGVHLVAREVAQPTS